MSQEDRAAPSLAMRGGNGLHRVVWQPTIAELWMGEMRCRQLCCVAGCREESDSSRPRRSCCCLYSPHSSECRAACWRAATWRVDQHEAAALLAAHGDRAPDGLPTGRQQHWRPAVCAWSARNKVSGQTGTAQATPQRERRFHAAVFFYPYVRTLSDKKRGQTFRAMFCRNIYLPICVYRRVRLRARCLLACRSLVAPPPCGRRCTVQEAKFGKAKHCFSP